jgi:nicotinamidase-related amidase
VNKRNNQWRDGVTDWEMHGKPALLILHMQQGLIGGGGQAHPGSDKAVDKSGIILRQQALLRAFRSKKLPIIYINVYSSIPTGVNIPVYGELWKLIRESKSLPHDMEVIPELAPQPGEPVLTNWPLGAFNLSGLEHILKAYNVDTIIPVGYVTNGVVLGVIMSAADYYYSVIVPSDASISPSLQAHQAVMEAIAPAIAMVTTTEDIIAHLR